MVYFDCGEKMSKRIIQAFIILIVILFGVSLISESNDKVASKESIDSFEENVSNEIEIENGSMGDVNVIEEDSSNLISDINAKIASVIVGGLSSILNFGLKIIESATR